MVLQVTCESSRGCYSVRNNSKTVDFRKFPRNCLDVGSKAQAISRARLLECLKSLFWYLQVLFWGSSLTYASFFRRTPTKIQKLIPKNPSRSCDSFINSLIDRKRWIRRRNFHEQSDSRRPWTVDHGINYFSVPPKKTHTKIAVLISSSFEGIQWWLASVCLKSLLTPLETNMTGWKSLTFNQNTSSNCFYFHLQVSRV